MRGQELNLDRRKSAPATNDVGADVLGGGRAGILERRGQANSQNRSLKNGKITLSTLKRLQVFTASCGRGGVSEASLDRRRAGVADPRFCHPHADVEFHFCAL